MPIRSVDPPTAHTELEADGSRSLIDVRTPEEFAAGHPAGAVNIPIAFMNAGGMEPNPRFVPTVQKHYDSAAELYLSCKMGGRSMRACQELEAAGYGKLVNVDGGFSGKPGVTGWSAAGLPVANDGKTYEQLQA